MKILLDTFVWGGAYKELKDAGYDVVWVGNWPEDPGDEEILEYAYKEGRILVTLDKDFGELAIVHDTPHSGILRIVNFPAQKQLKSASMSWTNLKQYYELFQIQYSTCHAR